MKQPTKGTNIYTLAQNGTSNLEKSAIIVNGKGSDLSNTKALKGKAKRKLITQKIILSLIDIPENIESPNRKKSYWNTYHCQNRLYTSDERIYGKFCKNRFCTLCCSVRKAVIINKYLPIIKTWSEPYFVTLTVKAVPLNRLGLIMRGIIRAFRKINSKFRKRHQRGKGVKLLGVKSLECNFNPLKRTYNPHLHLIVPNKQIADILIDEWLKIWTPKFTDRKGQDKRAVTDLQKGLIEIVKYGGKIFTEPDVNKKKRGKGEHSIYIAALNNIFTAMKGLRIFERFGFNLSKHNTESISAIVLQPFDEWVFDPKYFDWLNIKNGQVLSQYKPLAELIHLLEKNIDTSLE